MLYIFLAVLIMYAETVSISIKLYQYLKGKRLEGFVIAPKKFNSNKLVQ